MSRQLKKRAQKKTLQSNTALEIKTIEKSLAKTPLNLAAQLNKETAQLKQKESKVKKALVKINALIKKSEKQVRSASSSKRAKKTLLSAQKTQAALNKEANQISQLRKTAIEQRERLLALSKHITQFETIWVKAEKPTNKKPSATVQLKQRKAKKPKPLAAVPVEKSIAAEEPVSADTGDFGLFDEQDKLAS